MTELLAPPLAYAYVLAFVRLFGFMTFLPRLGELELPMFGKFIICASLTPFFLIRDAILPAQLSGELFLILLIKEVLVGMFLGFVVGLPLRLPEMIGTMIDNQRGAAVTDQYNPASGEESSLLGQLLMISVVTYFYTNQGFDYLIGVLGGSFALYPVTGFELFTDEGTTNLVLTIVTNYLKLFGVLCLPVIGAMLMADIALGTASRYAQALNVFSLAQPVKAVLGIGLLISLHPKITTAVIQFMNQTVSSLGL